VRLAAGLALCASVLPLNAQQPKQKQGAPSSGGGAGGQEKKKEFEFGEKVREAFAKIKPLQDAQDWNGMLKLLESIPVTPGSYDEAYVLNMKAKLYGQLGQFAKALGPWERAVQLSDEHGYFPEKEVTDIVYYLGQLYAQEASTIKDPKLQQESFAKAVTYFKRYMEKMPKPTPEAISTYASILYYKAVADQNNPDQAALKEARALVERGLTMSIKPREIFYSLLLALQQQQNDFVGVADTLELLLKQNPQKKDSWMTLMAIYLQLAEKAKDPAVGREYRVRAILTMERAQALGFANTPKDNMNLVSLYLQSNQFTKGTELLYNGMKKGTIESEPLNWRLLGRFYQEANMNEQAIAVLQEATKLFPKNGELEVQIAQIHIQMEKTKEAFQHAKTAIAKGNFEGTKPYGVYYLLAYTAYDLGDMDEAAKAIAEAEKFDESKKDPQFSRLKDVVTEAIAERDAKKKEKEKENATPVKKTARN
jgi:tetratricopeptide (TPR) repeat protein